MEHYDQGPGPEDPEIGFLIERLKRTPTKLRGRFLNDLLTDMYEAHHRVMDDVEGPYSMDGLQEVYNTLFSQLRERIT